MVRCSFCIYFLHTLTDSRVENRKTDPRAVGQAGGGVSVSFSPRFFCSVYWSPKRHATLPKTCNKAACIACAIRVFVIEARPILPESCRSDHSYSRFKMIGKHCWHNRATNCRFYTFSGAAVPIYQVSWSLPIDHDPSIGELNRQLLREQRSYCPPDVTLHDTARRIIWF